jgi:uncharacterized peroxidase-related enzyme
MSTQSEGQGLGAAPPSLSSTAATNLSVVEPGAASGEVAELYHRYQTVFGRNEVPGILKCFATHPPLLRSMMDLAQSFLFVDGHLSRCHKEMIATFVSSRNECPYCADSHGYFLRVHGGSEEALCAVQQFDVQSSALSAAEQELLAFADKVNSASQTVQGDDIARLHRAGWNDAQISEVIHIVSLFAAFNRIANAFGLRSQRLLDQFMRQ